MGVNTLVSVPLSIGKAGQFTSTFSILGYGNQITVDFYAWTPGTLTFDGLTQKGVPLPTVIAMGSIDGLLPHDGRYNEGPVTLVSPSKVSINGLLQRRTASFTSLKLYFSGDPYEAPEPSTLLLLGAGALALGLRGRFRS